MDDTKLNRILDDLRTDVNDLLTKSYTSSEVSLDALQDKLSTLSTNFYTLESEMTNLVASINTNSQNITALTQQSENTQTRLDELQTNQTTFTETLATHLLDFSTYAQKVDNQRKVCTQTQQTALDNFNALKEFFEVFLTETEINSATTNVERITALKDYFLALKTHLATYNSAYFNAISQQIDNLETSLNTLQTSYQTLSQTVSALSNSVDALTPRVETLEDGYQTMQDSISALNTKVEKYITPPDPYYVGKSFSDYPAGTIVQTYDYDERIFDIQKTDIITTPTLYFTTETASTGTIKLTQKVCIDDTTTLTMKVYLNTTLYHEQTFSAQADTEHTYEIELFDCNFNQETNENNIYTTFVYTGTNKTMALKYQKIEITSPNARFLNKICPFNAYYCNGMYYLTDCSTGILKTAEIEASKMQSMNDVTWVDTQIPAQECQTGCSYSYTSNKSSLPNKIYKLRRTLSNKLYIGTEEDNFEKTNFSSAYEMDYTAAMYNEYVNFTSTTNIGGNGIYVLYYIPSTNKTNRTTIDINGGDYVKVTGVKFCDGNPETSMPCINLKHCKNGECYLRTSQVANSAEHFQLIDGSISTAIIKNFESVSKFDITVYIKHYDKTIKYDFSYNSTTSPKLTLNSTIEFGTHDKVFEMPNGYYFAVKNKRLLYFKQQEEQEE